MAKVDITGLLTGLAGTDLQQEGITRASAIQGTGLGSNLARQRALSAPRREQMMSQGAGGLFGIDTRTAGEQVKEQLGQLDVTTPDGQKQAVQLVAQIDPTRALALQTQFADKNKVEALRLEAQDKEQERFEITRKDKAKEFGLAERKMLATEKDLSARGLDTIKVERYDPVTGKNVIDFVLKNDPTKVVSTVMAPQDPVKLYASIQREMLKNSTLIQESRARGASALKVARLLEAATPTAGVFGSIEEAIKAAGGTQDDASAARTAAEALVQSEAIISLPQGPATDKDIELARRGQPPANASPEYLASYARGIAKLADVEARYFREKNAWLSLYQNPRGFDSSQTIKGSERTLEEFDTPTEKAILKAARESIGTPQEAANRALFEKEFGFDIKLFDEDLDLARKVIADVEKDR